MIDPTSSRSSIDGLRQSAMVSNVDSLDVGMQDTSHRRVSPASDDAGPQLAFFSDAAESGPLPPVYDIEAPCGAALAAATKKDIISNEPAVQQEPRKVPKLLRRRIALVSCFAFVAGWVDVLTLIQFDAFAGNMTGNIIVLGATLSRSNTTLLDKEQSWWYYLVVIACNILGAFVAGLIQVKSSSNADDDRGWRWVWKSMAVRTAWFAFIMTISGAIVVYVTNSKYAILPFASALGAQNTLTGSTKELGVPTTAMTSNVQKVGILIAKMKIFALDKHAPLTLEEQLTLLLPVFASFATLLGAIFGGLLTRYAFQFSLGSAFVLIAFVQMIPYVLTDRMLLRTSRYKRQAS